MTTENKTKTHRQRWYAAGLAFACTQCGNCCSGPGEGVIWVTKHEIKLIAQHLGITVAALRQQYLKRIHTRTTIIEEPESKDCIFLKAVDGRKICSIYPVRPNQCRTWPFWSENLASPDTWNEAGTSCPGINRGACYDVEAIETLRKQKKWWSDEEP